MKIKFKHQKFQAEASNAVCDVFSGQPFLSETQYMIDRGEVQGQIELHDFTGFPFAGELHGNIFRSAYPVTVFVN